MLRFGLAVAMVLLVSGAGWATAPSGKISGSAHDLSSSNATYARQGGEQHFEAGFDRICAYCHTPHKGDLTVTNAPLWNRTNPDISGYDYYDSPTLTAAARGVAAVANSDVPLCMSCHDGSSLTAPLKNPVGNDDNTFSTMGAISGTSTALLLDGTNSLTNDHPVGFRYDQAEGDVAETNLHPLGDAKTAGVAFFGTGANEMWCSSCHAVHNPGLPGDNNIPFLRIGNAGSALCLACHDK